MVGNSEWNKYITENTESQFPKLATSGYRFTSQDTSDYNCVAYAAGEEDRWWWPDALEQQYWPPGVPREETVEAFIKAYQVLGFEVCQDASLEKGFQKIAIYTDSKKVPTHVALQLSDGKWTSKLGSNEDIKHESLDGLTGDKPAYGQVVCFLKKRLQA